jgi:hypothetical protein
MAQWFKFTKDYDYPVSFGVDKAFKAGTTVFLTNEQLEAAEAAKAGQRTTKDGEMISVEPVTVSDTKGRSVKL